MKNLQWHIDRQKGIGGSDAAAALGLSHWTTPLELYEQKIQTITEDMVQAATWEQMQGNAMEPVLLQQYATEMQIEVLQPKDAMVHPKHQFMRYNPDGIVEKDGVRILLELKTARWSRDWDTVGSDGIPMAYLAQVQHGMAVAGIDLAHVYVSIGGARPILYAVEADKEAQQQIIDGEAVFWQHVENRVPPAPVTYEDAANLYKFSQMGTTIVADDATLAAMQQLKAIRAQQKELNSQEELLAVQVQGFIKDNEALVDAEGKVLATWKGQAGAKRVNSALLREKFPDIAEQVTTQGEPTRRFLIK